MEERNWDYVYCYPNSDVLENQLISKFRCFRKSVNHKKSMELNCKIE